MFLSIVIENAAIKGSALRLHEDHDRQYYVLQNSNKTIRVYLRRRFAYPTTYCCRNDDGSYGFGYGTYDPDHNEEYLQITLRPDGHLTIKRDAYSALPLYVGRDNDTLIISNIYQDVLDALRSRTISRSGLIHELAGQIYTTAMLCSEIRLLGERESLEYDNGRVTILEPPSRSWISSVEAAPTSPNDFREVFNQYFDHFVATRLNGQSFACEVSGGLDSSTLPLFLKRRGIRGYIMASLIFTGEYAATQLQKLGVLIERTGARSMTVSIKPESDFPLHSFVRHDASLWRPFHARDSFDEVFNKLATHLRQTGVKVISTGLGGDEIFANMIAGQGPSYGSAEYERRKGIVLPSFTTPQFRDAFIRSVPLDPQYATPLHSLSLYRAHSANNRYIEHDIWPVTPFANPNLFAFCQGLPVHFRANKNALRIYHEAHNFPMIIYNPSQNEDFGGALEYGIQSGKCDALIQTLLESSVTVKMGYVDKAKLLAVLEASKQGRAPELWPLELLTWMEIEINLQSSGFTL